jgi:hypothetical protein
MKYRSIEVMAEESISSAGTKTIDLKGLPPISRLTIAWRVTLAGEGLSDAPHKDISRIEIVDGSEVLYSSDGGQAQALPMYDRRIGTMNHGQYLGSNSMFSTFGIDFGRFLHDPQYAFLPDRFQNPQLKITHNYAVADTGASSGNLAVYAEAFDERVITPAGFFQTKEVYKYTNGSQNSYEYVSLPTDLPIRQMLLQGYRDAFEPWDILNEMRLDEDTDKRVPLLWSIETYFRLMKGSWPPVDEPIVGLVTTTSRTFYTHATDYYATIMMQVMESDAQVQPQGWNRGGKCSLQTESTNAWFWGRGIGYLPNHCVQFPFGDQQDPEDWYDPRQIGKLRLRLKAGASGTNGSTRIILQQVRPY